MISSYSITNQDVITNGLINFTTNRILTGCTVTYSPIGQTFQLNKPGYYFITFNGVGLPTTTVGEVSIELQSNGVTVPGTLSAFTPAAVTDTGSVSFSTIIKVAPSCCAMDNRVSLSVVNTGVPTTFTSANINITKLC
jgi:hypothetical protein